MHDTTRDTTRQPVDRAAWARAVSAAARYAQDAGALAVPALVEALQAARFRPGFGGMVLDTEGGRWVYAGRLVASDDETRERPEVGRASESE